MTVNFMDFLQPNNDAMTLLESAVWKPSWNTPNPFAPTDFQAAPPSSNQFDFLVNSVGQSSSAPPPYLSAHDPLQSFQWQPISDFNFSGSPSSLVDHFDDGLFTPSPNYDFLNPMPSGGNPNAIGPGSVVAGGGGVGSTAKNVWKAGKWVADKGWKALGPIGNAQSAYQIGNWLYGQYQYKQQNAGGPSWEGPAPSGYDPIRGPYGKPI